MLRIDLLLLAFAVSILGVLASPSRAQRAEDPVGNAPIRDSRNSFSKRALTWRGLRRRNVVMQQRDYSCGAAALATLIKYFWGDEITEQRLLQELDKMLTREEARDRIQNGLTLTDLRRVAAQVGYQSSIGELEYQKLTESKVPLVVGIKVNDYRHFVVYRGTDGRFVYLADPFRGNVRTPVEDFVKQWQQKAVLAVAKPDADIPAQSLLTVSDEEKSVGTLNDQLIRKNFLSPSVRFRMTIRP